MKTRILIVDDDRALCEELADYLQESGFIVDHVQLPEQGIERLSQDRYDVLLLDFKMPQFDGIELLKRSQDKVKGVKIFFISGSLAVVQKLKEQGLSSLVAGVFSKPFDLQALQSAITDAVKAQ
jgi:DNA-binding response OmpR family regulator